MEAIHKQVIVIGGGPGGLAAAVKLWKEGVRDLLILEREHQLGGILRQCIHDGFGLTRFGETLSGPEYAQRFIDEVLRLGIPYETDTTVTGLTAGRAVTAVSRRGLGTYQADAVVLAMGCRERTRGALSIPGQRPAGVYTAGVAQAYLNLKNIMVGRQAVILGSGDIGMIMARRMTLEGAHVKAVYEIQPYPSGLPRNIQQCLNDYDIPLCLSHTITEIRGKSRLESVVVSRVDESLRPIPGTEQEIPCDTLILSVGLIPENELSLQAGVALDEGTRGPVVDEHLQTTVPGIFAAGNVLHVHDLVDFVSLEAEKLASAVGTYLREGLPTAAIPLETDGSLCQLVPQRITGREEVQLSFRPARPGRDGTLQLWQDGVLLAEKRVAKAIPAEMEQLTLKAAQLRSQNPVKVVMSCD